MRPDPGPRWHRGRSPVLGGVLCVALTVIAGCALAPGPAAPALPIEPGPTPELLDPVVLGGAPVPDVAIDRAELFRADAPMRAFVRRWVPGPMDPVDAARRLLTGMQLEGLLDLAYDETATWTPAQTFRRRRGNCLSFTLLFAALAREAGLPVEFREVATPPVWSRTGDFVVNSRHVNLRIRSDGHGGLIRNAVIDFNLVAAQDAWPVRRIDRDRLVAAYHGNQGVLALARADLPRAFAHFRAALRADRTAPIAWLNLGQLHARLGRDDLALRASAQALRHAPEDPSALGNAATILTRTGHREAAARLRALQRDHLERNPYWHSERARLALGQGHLDEALQASARAVDLRGDDPRLLAQRAGLLLAARRDEAARSTFERALALAEDPADVRAVRDKMARLREARAAHGGRIGARILGSGPRALQEAP